MDTIVPVSAPAGPHRADDRRPGRAVRAAGRPPHLDLARAGRPGRQRRRRHVHHRAARRRPTGCGSPSACCPARELPAARLAEWTTAAIADLEAHVGPFPYRDAHRGPAARLRRRHRVPELDPPGQREPAGPGARGRAHVVLRHGRQLAVPRPLAGRGVRHLRRVAARPRRGRPPAAGAGRRRATSARSMADFRRRPALLHRGLRQGRRRSADRPRRPPAPRRSTRRCAATSTPTPGRSPPRPTSGRRWPTCRRRSVRSRKPRPSAGRRPARPRPLPARLRRS